MKLSQFLTKSYLRGGATIPPEVDPLLMIITRIGMNRYSLESQILLRTCLAVVAIDDEIPDSDIWGLGSDARGLLNAFAMRRLLGKYPQSELDLFSRRLNDLKLSGHEPS